MIGKTLGHYQITNQIGKGGMGEVWKARDTRLGRIVAIKKVKEQHSESLNRNLACRRGPWRSTETIVSLPKQYITPSLSFELKAHCHPAVTYGCCDVPVLRVESQYYADWSTPRQPGGTLRESGTLLDSFSLR